MSVTPYTVVLPFVWYWRQLSGEPVRWSPAAVLAINGLLVLMLPLLLAMAVLVPHELERKK